MQDDGATICQLSGWWHNQYSSSHYVLFFETRITSRLQWVSSKKSTIKNHKEGYGNLNRPDNNNLNQLHLLTKSLCLVI